MYKNLASTVRACARATGESPRSIGCFTPLAV
jgi:hypothetical protein